MAHEIQSTAWAGNAEPWDGLGNKLPRGQSIDTWARAAGMNWTISETDVLYSVSGGEGIHLKSNADAKVLFRSDTFSPLSVVGKRYKVVQPAEVLEFYRDLVSAGGWEIETAGVLRGGRRLWALARTGQEVILKGNDNVKAFLLLATSCDGSLCTTARWTSIRVACSNSLNIALGESGGVVKVPHSTEFDPVSVKQQLGLGLSAWEHFITDIKALSERKLNEIEAMNYLVNALGDPSVPLADQPNQKALQAVHGLYLGGGKGSELASANGTLWGLLNGVTEYVDSHRRARSQDYRLDSAWFGQGAAIKEKAFHEAMKLAA